MDTPTRSDDRLHAPCRRVLVAEDDAVNRLVMVEMLCQLGCKVAAVEDGLSAVDAAQGDQFDLAILDVHMPGASGLTAARATRALQASKCLDAFPIVICTASAMEHECAQYLASGMDDVLVKPFMIGELEALLNRWMATP